MKKRSRHSWVKPRIRGWSGITSHSPQAASGGAVATKSSIATESLDLPRPLPWAIRWLYTLLASILIFSRVVVLPKWVPDILLDSSFASALTYFRSHGIQFGKDAIYTFGPLGHLITGIYTGHVWRVQFAGGFALAAFMALLFSVTASRLPRLGGLLLVVATLLAGTNDAIYLATPAIAYLFVFSARRQEHIPLVLIGAGMALVSLLKFSFFPVAICTIVAVVVLLWRRKNRVLAAIFGSAYLAAYTTLWAVFGGGWRAFLYYIRGSLEVSAGYAQTMYLAPKPEQLYFGLGCAALCTLIVGLPFVFGANILSKSNALIWAATLFLSWKHSFLRGDSSHLLTFFCFLPFFIAGTLVIRQSKQLQVVARISGAALLFLAIIAHSRIDPELFVHMRPAVFCAETWQDLRVALQVNVKIRQLREALASQAQLYDLGDWKTIVGSNPLDVYGQAQSLAILNGFNYRPRPAFQSFESSTAYLMRRNYEYYLTSPPSFVLYGNETIDGRYPAQDDSLAQAWILTNYVPVGTNFDHPLGLVGGVADSERR